MRYLLLTILIISALEIGVFIWIGQLVGPWWVVFLILMTALFGISYAKKQGMETLAQVRQMLQYGQTPKKPIIDGLCILIGAILLIMPGFITDLIGILLIIPLTRKPFTHYLKKWLTWKFSNRTIIYRR